MNYILTRLLLYNSVLFYSLLTKVLIKILFIYPVLNKTFQKLNNSCCLIFHNKDKTDLSQLLES